MKIQPHVTLQESLCKSFESIASLANKNKYLIYRGRSLNTECMVQIGDILFLIRIDKGRILEITRKFPLFQNRDFILKGSIEAWSNLWEVIPKAGWHDIFALIKKGEMTLEGEMQPVFAHLQYLKDVFTIPRYEVKY